MAQVWGEGGESTLRGRRLDDICDPEDLAKASEAEVVQFLRQNGAPSSRPRTAPKKAAMGVCQCTADRCRVPLTPPPRRLLRFLLLP